MNPAKVGDDTLSLCTRCGLPLLHEFDPCLACAQARTGEPQQIGPYPVLSRIGQGKHATVFRCEDADHTEIALKSFDRDPPHLERTLRDARLAARIRHKGIVGIRAIGRCRGKAFVASEYINGPQLEQLLIRTGGLVERDALLITHGAASALSVSTAAGLLHRNLKLTNVFIDHDGEIRLADFGGYGNAPADLPAPPEVRRGGPADPRSDIFSLGLLFAYMLRGGPQSDAAESIAEGVNRARPMLHAALQPLLERMTAFEPQDRFSSYVELLAAIDAAIHSVAIADQMRMGLDCIDQNWAPRSQDFAATAAMAGTCAALVLLLGAIGWSSTEVMGTPAGLRNTKPVATNSSPPRRVTNEQSLVLGAESGHQDFVFDPPDLPTRGGRLWVPRGQNFAARQRDTREGDVRASLTFVLDTATELSFRLITDDGREIGVVLRATGSYGPGVELRAGRHHESVASVPPQLEPRVPHLLAVARADRELRIELDGKELMRADLPMSGPYRIGFATPTGGTELRNLYLSGSRAVLDLTG